MLVARTMCAVTLIQGKNSNPFNVDIPLLIVCVTSNWHIHNSSRNIIICVTRWTDVITVNMYNINNGDKNRGSWVFVCASLSNWNWNGKQMGMCEHVIFNWSVFLKDHHHQCVSIYFWIFLIWNCGWPQNQSTSIRDIHFEAHIVWNEKCVYVWWVLLCGCIWSIDRQKQMILIEKLLIFTTVGMAHI